MANQGEEAQQEGSAGQKAARADVVRDAAIGELRAMLRGRTTEDQQMVCSAMVAIGLRHMVLLTAMPRAKFLECAGGVYDNAVKALPPLVRDLLGLS